MNPVVNDTKWNMTLELWRNSVSAFATAYDVFIDKREAALASGRVGEWADLNNKALTVRNTVTKIAGPLNSLYSWVSTLTGGLKELSRISGLAGLGFVPLVPFAVVNGSVAAVVYMTAELNRFNNSIRG